MTLDEKLKPTYDVKKGYLCCPFEDWGSGASIRQCASQGIRCKYTDDYEKCRYYQKNKSK